MKQPSSRNGRGLPRCLLLILMLSLVLSAPVGCQSSRQGDGTQDPASAQDTIRRHYLYDYFDTQAIILATRIGENDFAAVCRTIEEDLAHYHRLFNSYDTFPGVTNIASLNAHAGKGPLTVDPELFELLSFCRDMYDQTDGLVNIAMGSVLDLWHQARLAARENPDQAKLPDTAQLQQAAEHSSIDQLILDRKNLTAELRDPQMLLDAGAIAKGFALEKIAQKAEARNVRNFAIDLGGDVRTLGTRDQDLGPWRIAIQNPKKDQAEPFIDVLEISSGCVFTSGIYERLLTVGGKNYHHIIDPATLFPAERYQSITVVTADAGKADALSTALFNCTDIQTKNLLERFQPGQVIWVDSADRITYWR